MTKPTYEELETEVRRLRAKLSFGEDEEFTKEVRREFPSAECLDKFQKKGKFIVRPADMWDLIFPDVPASTRDLAKLGRSLQAMGWARSARLGNVVFTLPIDEYEK